MYLMTTSQVIQVGTVAEKLPVNPLIGRKYITIQNVGGATVYLGNTAVTADTAGTGGFVLLPYGTWREHYTHEVDIWGVVADGTGYLLVEEGK